PAAKFASHSNLLKSSSSRSRKKTPTAAQPAQAKTSLPRKTASLLSLCQGRVSNGLISPHGLKRRENALHSKTNPCEQHWRPSHKSIANEKMFTFVPLRKAFPQYAARSEV